jgi:hypothetical protein
MPNPLLETVISVTIETIMKTTFAFIDTVNLTLKSAAGVSAGQ